MFIHPIKEEQSLFIQHINYLNYYLGVKELNFFSITTVWGRNYRTLRYKKILGLMHFLYIKVHY